MEFKLRYRDFWPNFSPERFLFTKIIQNLIGSQVTLVFDRTVKVDLEIVSVFLFKSKATQMYSKIKSFTTEDAKWDYLSRAGRGFKSSYPGNAKKRIWYTGENLRAPSGQFDGTIGFDPTSLQSKNIYFPYWMLRLDWGFGSSEFEIMPKPNEMMEGRTPHKRPLQVCSFSNRKETTRENLIRLVEKSLNVDKYGAAHQNFKASKLSIMNNYGLQICSENDMYPNYITEKIPEAWYGRNVPLWKGLDMENWFNKEAMYDFSQLSDDEVFERLARIEEDEVLYKQSLPILNRMPNLEELSQFFSRFLFN